MTRRVLTARIKHETNTFSILPTTLDSYPARVFLEGGAVLPALKGANNEIAGVLDIANEEGWDLVAPIAADAPPSGKVSAETCEDPEAALAAVQAGVGAELTMPRGGKFDPTVTPSFQMTGTVKYISAEGKFSFEGPMMCGVAGITSPDPKQFSFRNFRRPIWPLDIE